MIGLNDDLPSYLLGTHHLRWTVAFTVIFALSVVLISLPFSHNAWLQLPFGLFLPHFVGMILFSILIVMASRAVLSYCSRCSVRISVTGFVLWCFAEILVISLIYTIFTVSASRLGIIDATEWSPLKTFFAALWFVSLCLGIPNIIAAMFLAIEDKGNTIRLMNYSSVVSDVPEKPYEEKRITLFDNNGVLKFSIDSDNLYFIESDDNYIKIWYSDNLGSMKQYMLRCRLKTVEDSFAGSELVRCHRKYIVNITKIRILKAEKEGYKIQLKTDNAGTIPISKTYEENVLSRFNSL